MLIAFTCFIPENSGLERFNYLASCFVLPSVTFVKVRGEKIPSLVEREGGLGWTGNDLYADYLASGRGSALRLLRFVPWPEPMKPWLCLLGPEEAALAVFERDLYSSAGMVRIAVSDKYANLAWDYFFRRAWSPAVFLQDGQVEKQIRGGEADLAVDIVYSGRTIREERLAVYDTLFDESGMVLIEKTYILPNNQEI